MTTLSHFLRYLLFCLVELAISMYCALELYPYAQDVPESYVFGDNPEADYIWIGGPPE